MPKKSAKYWEVRHDNKIHDAIVTRYSKDGQPELDVIFEWKTIGRRLEVVSVCVRRTDLKSAITAGDIRSIPFSYIETMHRTEQQTQPDVIISDWLVEFEPGPQSGKPLTTDELQLVAELYREARNLGIPTARHIAKTLKISESAVRKRISAARKSGLLGAAVGTQAGERLTTSKRKGK